MNLENVKIGDKLRYLGGDPVNEGELVQGHIYEIYQVDDYMGEVSIDLGNGETWGVGDLCSNTHCFELVREEFPDKTSLDLIANLSAEVTRLKRELAELSDAIQAQKHEDNARIEMLMDDIVMLDERTQGVSSEGRKLLSKEVYIYDTE